MPNQNYQIIKSQFPIVKGLAGHNLLVLKDSFGKVIGELDGLATSKDGKIKPIGYLPSDRLIAYSFNRSYLYDKHQSQVVLFAGSKKETLEKWHIAKKVVEEINQKNLGYPFLGIGLALNQQTITWGKNSNSIASTLIRAMALQDIKIASHKLTPGEGHNLMTDKELHHCQRL